MVTRSAGILPSVVGVHLVAGAGTADELGEREQLLGVAPGEDVGQRVGAGDEVELGVGQRCACRSRSVSMVYVGPARSMSTRETENRGLDAVAITVIR